MIGRIKPECFQFPVNRQARPFHILDGNRERPLCADSFMGVNSGTTPESLTPLVQDLGLCSYVTLAMYKLYKEFMNKIFQRRESVAEKIKITVINNNYIWFEKQELVHDDHWIQFWLFHSTFWRCWQQEWQHRHRGNGFVIYNKISIFIIIISILRTRMDCIV